MPLSFAELAVIFGIVFLMSIECIQAVRSRSWIQIYRPTLFVAVILAFYVLVGPLRAILATGEQANFVGTTGTIYRDLDHRGFLIWGWIGALVFYGCMLVGFYGFRQTLNPRFLMLKSDLLAVRQWGVGLCWLGLIMYVLVHGDTTFNLLNPFSPADFGHTIFGFKGLVFGPFNNYFKLAINLLIPGIVIQFSVWLRKREGLWQILLWTLLASLIFLSETFRYRFLLLIIPVILLWLFYHKLRPRLIFILVFMFMFVGLNGVVGISRTHLRGLDVTNVLSYSPLQVFNSSFEEAGVFFTTSAVIHSLPERIQFVGWAPLVNAALQPIPRELLSKKPRGEYSSDIREKIYNSPISFTAYLNYAEYYLAFGWVSVVGLSLLLGVLLRRLWTWFLWRQYEPIAQAVYLLNSSYLYVVISRGYLAQVVMLYCFTVLPIVIAYYFLSDRV